VRGFIGFIAMVRASLTVLLMSPDLFVENVGSADFNITDFDFTFQDVTTNLLS
jgi:hypothetical protein